MYLQRKTIYNNNFTKVVKKEAQNVVYRNEKNLENLKIGMTCLKCHRDVAKVFCSLCHH